MTWAAGVPVSFRRGDVIEMDSAAGDAAARVGVVAVRR